MLMKCVQFLLQLVLINVLSVEFTEAYRKYYIEDECTSPNNFQKISYRLPASGRESVGEMRPNRFGTYSRMGRNCLVKLIPPEGYGVIVTVLRIDFRNHEGCKDYIKIYNSEDEGERLCGFQEGGLDGKTYFADDELKIRYHTSEGGMGFSNGFKLIFTVTNLVANASTCSSLDGFLCDNSRCIWTGVTCDGINNCGDASDEKSTNNPHCRMYQQLYKNFLSRLAGITPVAITAVVLGITSFIAILVIMCLCCCRSQSDKPIKPPLMDNFPLRPNAGYTPLPGYIPLPGQTYASPNAFMQPVHSPVHASAPPQFPTTYPAVPYMQQKVEIRYDRPPPYNA